MNYWRGRSKMLRDFCFYPVRMLTESLLLLLYLWVMKTVCKQTLLRADVQKPPTILLLKCRLCPVGKTLPWVYNLKSVPFGRNDIKKKDVWGHLRLRWTHISTFYERNTVNHSGSDHDMRTKRNTARHESVRRETHAGNTNARGPREKRMRKGMWFPEAISVRRFISRMNLFLLTLGSQIPALYSSAAARIISGRYSGAEPDTES